MRLDLVGSVEQLRLTPSNCLYPIFEAVSNSIHAIRDFNPDDGLIRLDLIRDARQGAFDLPSALEPSGRGIAEIVEVHITDNGEGFSTDNFLAFNELYTRRKSELGAKGVGRLTWLKVFDRASVTSVYRKGEAWRCRTFDFALPDGVENVKDDPLPDGKAPAPSTTVTLVSPRPEYQESLRRRTSTVRDAIERHFLAELLSPNAPRIEVADSEGSLVILLEGVSGRHSTRFSVKEQQFKIEHLKIRSPEKRSHMVHFCADRRSVRQEIMRNLPDVRFQEGDDQLYYHAYVSSPYLDTRVDQQRTGFAIEDDSDLVPEPSLTEIRTEVGKAACQYLDPYLRELASQRDERVAHVLEHRFPDYRYLRHQNGDDLKQIALDATERQVEDEIAKLHFHNQKSGREEMQDIIDRMQASAAIDIDTFLSHFTDQIERISRASQADLAGYMLYRRSIIQLFAQLQRKTGDQFQREAAIHQLVFPMGKDLDTTQAFAQNNLWLIDERLTFADYIASDMALRRHKALFGIQDKDEPDLVAYYPLTFSTDDPARGSLRNVVIVEFKRPGKLQKGDEDPWEQVTRYIEKMQEGYNNVDGQKVKASDNTRFYCFIICDTDDSNVRKFLKKHQFVPLFDGEEGWFLFHWEYKAYAEVRPFTRLLVDAERNHRMFFDKLGLLNARW